MATSAPELLQNSGTSLQEQLVFADYQYPFHWQGCLACRRSHPVAAARLGIATVRAESIVTQHIEHTQAFQSPDDWHEQPRLRPEERWLGRSGAG